jgi:hypothetical protein
MAIADFMDITEKGHGRIKFTTVITVITEEGHGRIK